MKLLLAEDTIDLNRAVSAILSHEKYEVDSVYDGLEALEHIKGDSYDGIILDIMMPKMTGIEVLTQIRKINVVTPVLLLTAKAEIDDRVAGLDAGADDYLTKPFAMKELLARVRAMTRRRTDYSAKKLTYSDITLTAGDFELACINSVSLSIKEFELMQLLILNAEKGVSTKYILDHVWMDDQAANDDTVFLYISYLRGKLKSVASEIAIAGEKHGEFKLEKNPVQTGSVS